MFARLAHLDDIDTLLSLELLCWEEHLRASREKIESRIIRFPKYQFVVVEDDEVCGVLYTQPISNTRELTEGSFELQEELSAADGSLLQLLAIAVRSTNGGNCAAFLRDFALGTARNDSQFTAVVAMTRCSAFDTTHASSSGGDGDFVEYDKHVQSFKDPTIFFHVSGGARVAKIVRGYRPEDSANKGCAILIEYTLDESSTKEKRRNMKPSNGLSFAQFMRDMRDQIIELKPKCARLESIAKIPFMSLLDSLQLQSLHVWLENYLQVKLIPTLLFSYTTPASLFKFISGTAEGIEILTNEHSSESIAIVGISCRFPGDVNNLADLWDLQTTKGCTTSRVPLDRWNEKTLNLHQHNLDPGRHSCVNWGSFFICC
jgi:hypothetical protein